jgi:hypothetical protein
MYQHTHVFYTRYSSGMYLLQVCTYFNSFLEVREKYKSTYCRHSNGSILQYYTTNRVLLHI